MTDREKWLAAVIARPKDDTPRLIFADWLDETGYERDARWAEMIRFQCRVSQVPHDHRSRGIGVGAKRGDVGRVCVRCDLEKQSRRFDAWACDNLIPATLIGRCTFRRGFVSEIACGLRGVWRRCYSSVVEHHPIRSLVLGVLPDEGTADIGPLIRGVDRVAFVGCDRPQELIVRLYADVAGWRGDLRFFDYDEYGLRRWIGNDPVGRSLIDTFAASHARQLVG